MFLEKEKFVTRKVPLNGYLNFYIGQLKNLKSGINNIQYLTALNKEPDLATSIHDRTFENTHCSKTNDKRDALDKHRAISQMYKEGLNLGVVISIFAEDDDLRDRFGKEPTRVILKTMNPIFEHEGEMRIKMDTGIFEYFKNNRAIFEVRHYFTDTEGGFLKLGQSMDNISNASSDFDTNERDFITLGSARLPLISLITNSSGF
jgi:hypothetical protein